MNNFVSSRPYILVTLLVILGGCESKRNSKVDYNQNGKSVNMDSSYFFEIQQDGINYKIPVLNEQEVKVYFDNKSAKEVKNTILDDIGIAAYQIKSGEVFVMRKGENEYPLYPSIRVLLTQLVNHDPSRIGSLLSGANIYGEQFPLVARDVASAFLKRYQLSLDKDEPLVILKCLDSVIRENRNQPFFQHNYLSLISIIGELVNAKCKSSWGVEKDDKTEDWTPFIRVKKSNVFFIDYILKDFHNKLENDPMTTSYLSVTDIIRINR